ncbi:hypothetical protein BJ138DRAFT_1187875 [Hygrophoropsis aurantiaca]|uniref:Uncharacterized protein n=1 Tax=Hygrophoropsis aurantiaca TaxID=72124 RepID=A0ACB7ZSM9_9AGAM|nr:hypothetical protein BJ138DRAFT_1187875 [Hygrophoropsis aurantiaca]
MLLRSCPAATPSNGTSDPIWLHELLVAARAAHHDPRECPWYEAWAILLSQFLFAKQETQSSTGLTTCTTCPQYALAYDTMEDEEEHLNSNEGSDDAEMPSPLSTPTRQPLSRIPRFTNNSHSSPSNRGVAQSPDHQLLAISSPEQRPVAIFPFASALTPNPSTPKRQQNKRSHWILDFVQFLRSINSRSLEIITQRTILVLEIKRCIPSPEWTSLFSKQILSQANHAFKSDNELQTLGAIAAFGNLWTFREYDRSSVPTDSEMFDPSYAYSQPASDPQPLVTTSRHPFSVPPCFSATLKNLGKDGSKGVLDIDNLEETMVAFEVILNHLKAMNATLWGLADQFTPGICRPCKEEHDQGERDVKKQEQDGRAQSAALGSLSCPAGRLICRKNPPLFCLEEFGFCKDAYFTRCCHFFEALFKTIQTEFQPVPHDAKPESVDDFSLTMYIPTQMQPLVAAPRADSKSQSGGTGRAERAQGFREWVTALPESLFTAWRETVLMSHWIIRFHLASTQAGSVPIPSDRTLAVQDLPALSLASAPWTAAAFLRLQLKLQLPHQYPVAASFLFLSMREPISRELMHPTSVVWLLQFSRRGRADRSAINIVVKDENAQSSLLVHNTLIASFELVIIVNADVLADPIKLLCPNSAAARSAPSKFKALDTIFQGTDSDLDLDLDSAHSLVQISYSRPAARYQSRSRTILVPGSQHNRDVYVSTTPSSGGSITLTVHWRRPQNYMFRSIVMSAGYWMMAMGNIAVVDDPTGAGSKQKKPPTWTRTAGAQEDGTQRTHIPPTLFSIANPMIYGIFSWHRKTLFQYISSS